MRQDHIPRGRTIPMGAVPILARGLGHTAPTYLRRRPGSPSNGLLGPALLSSGSAVRSRPCLLPQPIPSLRSQAGDRKSELRRQALDRRRDVDAGDARRAERAARRSSASNGRGAGGRASSPPSRRSATSPTPGRCSPPCRRTASPPRCRSSTAARRRSPSACGGPANRWRAARWACPSPARRPRWSNPTCCSCRSPPSIGAAIASATAPAITTGR